MHALESGLCTYSKQPPQLPPSLVAWRHLPAARPPNTSPLDTDSLLSRSTDCPRACPPPQSGAYYDVWLDGEKFMSHYKEVRG